MVNIAKVGDSAVKFTFTDNDHYLFNGEIEVPLNSLLLILDESDMATFKKIDGDPFVSFLISNSNFDSKEALETFYKENMVGSTGGGLTPEEAQTMIDDSISGKADTSAVTEAISAAVSGKADTSTVEAISNGLTAHTSNSAIHVTANDKSTWNGKQDALVSGSNIKTVNNESLLGSGNIEIEGGNNVVEVTQAEYDALVTAGTVDLSAIYVITDAPEIDMSNYYTSAQTNSAITAAVSGKADTSAVTESINAAVSGKMDTSAFTAYSASTDARISEDEEVTARALVEVNDALSGKADASGVTAEITAAVSGKQDTLIAGDNITISGNVISAEGGGSSYTGLSGITINENNEIYYKNFVRTWLTSNHDDRYAVYWFQGANTKIWINGNKPDGRMNWLKSQFSFGLNQLNDSTVGFALGENNSINGQYSGGLCNGNTVNGNYSLGVNYKNKTNNSSEFASGQYNNSVSASSTFGDSGNTLFSVGNGTADNARHNAFEIRQNGDIYITLDGQDVKLQDNLGGGEVSSAITSGDTNAVAGGAVYDKFDEVEQVTAAALNSLNDALGGMKFVKLTQAEYDALAVKDPMTVYFITNVV